MSRPAKAARTTPPRLSGNLEYDRGAEDDLDGVLARIITGFTGTGGVADLALVADDSQSGPEGHARTSFHYIARKFWRDAAGGPRIELLEIKKFQAPQQGWVDAYEKLELKAGEWAMEVIARPTPFGGAMEPWSDNFSNAVDNMEETVDVEKIKAKTGALRFYMDRKKAALEHLARTWDAVEIPLGEI